MTRPDAVRSAQLLAPLRHYGDPLRWLWSFTFCPIWAELRTVVSTLRNATTNAQQGLTLANQLPLRQQLPISEEGPKRAPALRRR